MWQRLFMGLVCVALLSGCGARLAPPPSGLELLPAEPSLWKLSLERRGRPLYAGLLLLSRTQEGGRLVLLDATGIKLLEELVASDGEVTGIRALRPVADRGLPVFLGRSIHRLFLSGEPAPGESCLAQASGELCLGLDEAAGLVKIRRWGPFVLWQAAYSINNEGPVRRALEARLDGGWFAPEVKLERQLEPAH